jgi:hypothetical protein
MAIAQTIIMAENNADENRLFGNVDRPAQLAGASKTAQGS